MTSDAIEARAQLYSIVYVSVYTLLFFSFSFWTLLAYIGIDYSQSVVYMSLLSMIVVGLYLLVKSYQFKVSLLNYGSISGLPTTAFVILAANTLPLLNLAAEPAIGWFSKFGTYFIGLSNGICLAIFLLVILQADAGSVIRSMKKFYAIVFSINFIVSLMQIIMFEVGLIPKEFFTGNERLAAIMMPGYGVGETELRVPGIFWNGGTNGIFCSIGCIFLFGEMLRSRKIGLMRALLFFSSSAVVYYTYTRRVWLALLVSLLFGLYLHLVHRTNIKNKIALVVVSLGCMILAVSLLIVLVAGSRIVDASQMLNAESLVDRIVEWEHYFGLLSSSSLMQLFFGRGILQEVFHLFKTNYLYIDNMVASLLLYSGVFGLISFLFLYSLLFFKSLSGIRSSSLEKPVYFLPILMVFSLVCAMFQNFWSDFYTSVTLYYIALPFIIFCTPSLEDKYGE